MECKVYPPAPPAANTAADLIETLWNVKINAAVIILRSRRDLIETLWNVKFIPCSCVRSYNMDLIETLWNVKFSFSVYQLFRLFD